MSYALAALVCSAGVVLSACSPTQPSEISTPAPENSAPASQETPSPSPSPSASDDAFAPEIGWEMGNSQKPHTPGSVLLAHDFRVGVHDDYYRVVIEFVGEGEPGWIVSWKDEAVEMGRGDPLPIPAGNVLDVHIEGTTMPVLEAQAEQYYSGPADKRLDEKAIAWFDGSFEGQTHVAISSDIERPYRIFTLEDPQRVVIDLQR
ncbi:MAG: hypothetical protein Q4P71_03645 [Actinomycetaceae bacterium]|nr:hypothetical protein [Actinomycetaceae bacterium]